MTLLCITNSMTDARSCTHKGEHTVYCDGFEYRFNPERHRDETTGRFCRGCLPLEARHGMLCAGCWERVGRAYASWTPEIELMLSTIDRAVQRDNGGIRSGPEGYVPIPGTALSIDEIRSYLRTFNGDLDLWVSAPDGAADAVRFARCVPSALRTHELEEKPHRINRTRCGKCSQLTLIWNPTLQPGDDVAIACLNPECGIELTQDAFDVVAEFTDAPNRKVKA